MKTFRELCDSFAEALESKSEDSLLLIRERATDLLIETSTTEGVRGATTAIYLIDQEFERRVSR